MKKKPASVKEKFRLYHNTHLKLRQWINLSDALLCVMTWPFGWLEEPSAFIIGFIFAANGTLPRIVAKIPWSTKLPSRIQRLWRWLKNPKVNSLLIAQSIAETWLANFRHKTIYLAIDRTDISDAHWLVFVGLAYRGRTFPLVWRVLPSKGSPRFRQQTALLKTI